MVQIKIRIYQFNPSRDKQYVRFMGLQDTFRVQGTTEINSEIYDLVFEGSIDCETLNAVLVLFNSDTFIRCKNIRALSVSDIVEVVSGSTVEPGFYYCDESSFVLVDFDVTKTQVQVPKRQTRQASVITALLIRPGQAPKRVGIDQGQEALQTIIGGPVECYMPFNDDVVLLCNEERNNLNLPLNRAIYEEPSKEEMTYKKLVTKFKESEKMGVHMTGYIVFTKESFDKKYSEAGRTYVVSSNNDAFQPWKKENTILGSALDGSDPEIRLDLLMVEGKNGRRAWKIEKCYIEIHKKEGPIDVIAGTFLVVAATEDEDTYASLPKRMLEKYLRKFRYPLNIAKSTDKTI